MPSLAWWKTVSAAELLKMRRRLLEHVEAEYGARLEAELEDIVQHAFVVLLRRREDVPAADDGLFRYLKIVARYAALDRIRSAARREAHVPRIVSDIQGRIPDGPPLQGLPRALAEEQEKIGKIFCALDDLERLVLWAYVVDEKPIREIARDLDLNWHRTAGIIREALIRMGRVFDT